jgi:Rrf2 family nitric oxide-sensitive transcriptional repressor
LRGALREAIGAFTRTLDRYTLADLILNPRDFGIKPAA